MKWIIYKVKTRCLSSWVEKQASWVRWKLCKLFVKNYNILEIVAEPLILHNRKSQTKRDVTIFLCILWQPEVKGCTEVPAGLSPNPQIPIDP